MAEVSAQIKTPVEVKKSKEKIIVGNEIYYLHKVEKGQTLYSISKVYKVTQKDIALKNPDVFEGLKTGKVLKIPADKKSVKKNQVSANHNYLFHILQKGETLYSLHKLYNVEVEAILKANPEVKYTELQIDQLIRIPKESIYEIPKDSIIIDKYFYHRVQKTETLYALSKKYNISQTDIEEANVNLKLEGLIEGSIIKIPNREYLEKFETEKYNKNLADSLFSLINNLDGYYYSKEKCDSFNYSQYKQEFKIALLLPFYIPTQDEIEQDKKDLEENDDESKISRKYVNGMNIRSFNFIEFYQGVLMALDSLKKSGLRVKLYVYDTKGDSSVVQNLINNGELDVMDAIIGPIFTKNLKIVAYFAREHNIPLISPLSNDSTLLAENSNFFQVNPSLGDGMDYLLKLISNKNNLNFLLIHNDDVLLKDYIKQLKHKILFCISSKDSLYNNFNEVVFVDTALERIRVKLSEDEENIILIPSEEEVYVSKVLSTLNILAEEYKITLVGYPIWTRFRSIDLAYFHVMNFHYFSPFYTDFSNEATKKYILDYRKHYNTDPYKVHYLGFNYSLLGYDITSYFLSSLMNYGTDFCHCMPYVKSDLHLSNYHFEKRKINEGFVNKSIQYINYTRDFQVKKVNSLEFSKPLDSHTPYRKTENDSK